MTAARKRKTGRQMKGTPFDQHSDEGLFEEDSEESGYEGVEAGITSDGSCDSGGT